MVLKKTQLPQKKVDEATRFSMVSIRECYKRVEPGEKGADAKWLRPFKIITMELEVLKEGVSVHTSP